MSKLSAHGSFKISAQGDLLIVDGWGPWNAETASDYARSVKNAALEMPGDSWAFMARFQQEPLMWQDTVEQILDAIRFRAAHGMKVVAVVTNALPESEIARMQYEQMYRDCGVEHEFFLAENDALAWLAMRGFGPESARIACD